MTTEPDPKIEGLGQEVPIIDPSGLEARLDEQGGLRLSLPDGRVYPEVKVAPAFPVSRPKRFLYLLDVEGKEIGLLKDPRRLDRQSRDLVLAQADQVYFMPRIRRILRVDENMGISEWEVETDRGWSTFEVVGRTESIWFMGKNRILLRDVDGDRYLIEDLSALDPRSRRLAELYL